MIQIQMLYNAKQQMFSCKLLTLLSLILPLIQSFSFRSLSVSPDQYLINKITTYTFFADRTINNSLGTTLWNSQLVSASSNVVIMFPNQYVATGYNCDNIIVSTNTNVIFSTTYTCSISGQNLTITGIVTVDSYIANISIIVSNVLNPSPAVTTDNFVIRIGNDVSQNESISSVTLLPTIFSQMSATFDSNIVNTTGSLILTLTSSNKIVGYSNIIIKFPSSLTWSRQISSGYVLALSSTLTCKGTSPILQSTIACSGVISTTSITLYNISKVDIAALTQLTFTISTLYSPPSIQSVDSLTVTSQSPYMTNYYNVDSSAVLITGLLHKTMTFGVVPLAAMIVNSQISLQFQITLPDTIYQNDIFKIYFPLTVGRFTYSFSTSSSPGFSLNSTATVYNSGTRVLTIAQRNSATVYNYANKMIVILVTTFTVPLTILPFSISMDLQRNGFLMAKGTTSLQALTDTYIGNITSTDLMINHYTSYSISITLKSEHSSQLMIDIIFPSNLFISPLNLSVSSNISAQNPTFILTGLRNITLTKFTSSTSVIGAQTILITFSNVVNPSSVQTIGDFSVNTYYSQNRAEQVSQSTISALNLITLQGAVDQSSVKMVPTSSINYQSTVYTLSLVISNPIQVNGYIIIKIPQQIGLSGLSAVKIESNITFITPNLIKFSLNLSSSTLKITNNLTSTLTYNEKIAFTLTNLLNPISSKSTVLNQLQIQSFDSLSRGIDKLVPVNSVAVQMAKPNNFSTYSLTRTSTTNQEIINITLTITQVQPISSNTILIVVIDTSVVIPPTINCITDSMISLTCSTIAKPNALTSTIFSSNSSQTYLSVAIPNSYVNSNTITLNIIGLTNPASFNPIYFNLFTLTSDLIYFYSKMQNIGPYSNTVFSNIVIVGSSFSIRQLQTQTNLTFNYQVNNNFNKMTFQVPSGFIVSSGTFCESGDFDISCIMTTNTTLSIVSKSNSTIPKQAKIVIQNIQTPSTANVLPLTFSILTVDSQGFGMGQNLNSITYDLQCKMPCKTCQAANNSLCLTCYDSSLSPYQYLLGLKCYQTCPDGYINNLALLICDACSNPCLTCFSSKTNCMTCNQTSLYIYLLLNTLTNSSTCVKQCPPQFYPDTNYLPVVCSGCQAPCLQCTSNTICISCANTSQVLYNGKCLNSCPIDISVQVTSNKTCTPCSIQCATCSILATNCTSCSKISIFYLSKCLTQCPSPLIKSNTTCISCSSKCLSCTLTPDNCTSCYKPSNLSYFYSNDCLEKCPVFYYSNVTNFCLSCLLLNIACKDCANQTTCNNCDTGYVLFINKCQTTVPQGYINISGVAVPCQGDCKTCFGTINNCTSCKTLNLNGNLCQSSCNIGSTAVNQTCLICQYPCQTCSSQIYSCTSCYTNSSRFLYQNQCLSNCPNQFYPNTTFQQCSACISPCLTCTTDSLCLACVNGYYFYANTSQCLLSCPDGMVGQNKLCVNCQAPCVLCNGIKTKCITCVGTFYFYLNQCLSVCPVGSVVNQLLQSCDKCQSPCITCENTTSTCLTCINTTNFFQNTCVLLCPDGYYSSSKICKACVSPCTSCLSDIICTSCTGILMLYNKNCIQSCPSDHAYIVNGSCLSCPNSCYSCLSSGVCLSCHPGGILFNSSCLKQCPVNYTLSTLNGSNACIPQTIPQKKLTAVLSKSSLFPLPFSIFGLIVIGAGLMSKLQNKFTYFIGFMYAIFGLIETIVVVYMIYFYYQTGHYQQITIYLMLAALALFYLLGGIAFLVQTCQLFTDGKFQNWRTKDHCLRTTTFWIATTISLLINYKFKLILFSRIFSFETFKAELNSIQKFKIFNAFSCCGILAQTILLYTIGKQLVTNYSLMSNQQSLRFIDCAVIITLNVVFSLISNKKDQDFFIQQIDGIAINKKITVDDQYYDTKGLKDSQQCFPYFQTRKTGYQSHQVMLNQSDVIEEYSDQYQISQSDKKDKSRTKDQLFFQEDLSSKTLRYKNQLDQVPIKFRQKKTAKDKIQTQKTQYKQQNIQKIETNAFQQPFQSHYVSKQASDQFRSNINLIEKSQNVFCQSSFKKQNEIYYQQEIKDNLSQKPSQQVKNLKSNKQQIQQSASQYNKIQNQKKMYQIIKEDSTKKIKQIQPQQQQINKQKQVKADIIPQVDIQEIQQIKLQKAQKIIQQNVQITSQKVQIASQKVQIASQKAQIIQQQQQVQPFKKSIKKGNFIQIQKSLKQSSQLEQFMQAPIKSKKNRNSVNTSKTDAFIKQTIQNRQQVNSQSQTIHQQGKLRPQLRDDTPQLQNQINNTIQQIQCKNQLQQYNFQKQKQNEIEFQDFSLQSSLNSESLQPIQKNPYNFKRINRPIIDRDQTVSQNITLLKLQSNLKDNSNKVVHNNLQSNDKVLQRSNNNHKANQQKEFKDVLEDKQQRKFPQEDYQKLISSINTKTNIQIRRKSSHKLPAQKQRQQPNKMHIIFNRNIQQSQQPINRNRKQSFQKKNYPIQKQISKQKQPPNKQKQSSYKSNQSPYKQKSSNLKKQIQIEISGSDQNDDQLFQRRTKFPPKRNKNHQNQLTNQQNYKKVQGVQRISHVNKVNKGQSTQPFYKSKQNQQDYQRQDTNLISISTINKAKDDYFQFDPVNQRINTRFNEEINDQLENFVLKRINMQSSHKPKNNINQRVNALYSADILPRPIIRTQSIHQNVKQNTSPLKRDLNKSLKRDLNKSSKKREQNYSSNYIYQQKDLQTFYKEYKREQSPQSRLKMRTTQKQIDSNQRLKDLEKIYLQRLH